MVECSGPLRPASSPAAMSMKFPPAGTLANWGEWLAGQEAVSSDVIRRQTHSGRPRGSAAFLSRASNKRRIEASIRGSVAARQPITPYPLWLSLIRSLSPIFP